MRAGKKRLVLPASSLALCALLLPSCSDNPVGSNVVDEVPPAWRVFSTSHTLDAVVTFDDGGGFAVADDGFTLVRSGGTWAPGGSIGGDGVVVEDLWGAASDDMFAVGTAGTILHYDGDAWADMTSGASVDLHGVWGTASDNVFAVGDGGTILRYDGAEWSAMASNTQSGLFGVHGTGPTQVFAVGNAGAFAEYDGTSWSTHNQGTRDLFAVYVPDSTEVLAAGRNGRLVRRKDGAWAPIVTGISDTWTAISGTSSNNVYVCSELGALVHYDGSAWSTLLTGDVDESLRDLWPSGSGVMTVAGGFTRVLEYTGDARETAYQAPVPTRVLKSVCQLANGDAFLSGPHAVWRIRGDDVTQYSFPSVTLWTLWGSGPDDVFVVGDKGSIFHFDGTAWTRQQSNTTAPLLWVDGTSSQDVLVVGYEMVHYDGNAWTPVTMPENHWFYDLWGHGYSQYMLVGYQGLAWIYTGAQWIELDTGTQQDLLGVWGSSWEDVFAVGSAGTVLHYDGDGWTPMESGTVEDLHGVWGRGASDIFAAGAGPGLGGGEGTQEARAVALHYDGESWRTILSNQGMVLFGVSGDANETIWVGGSTVLEYGR